MNRREERRDPCEYCETESAVVCVDLREPDISPGSVGELRALCVNCLQNVIASRRFYIELKFIYATVRRRMKSLHLDIWGALGINPPPKEPARLWHSGRSREWRYVTSADMELKAQGWAIRPYYAERFDWEGIHDYKGLGHIMRRYYIDDERGYGPEVVHRVMTTAEMEQRQNPNPPRAWERAIKQVIDAIQADEKVSITELSERLDLNRSQIEWRVEAASRWGWLVKHQCAPGHERSYNLGTPMPPGRITGNPPEVPSVL